RLALAYPQFTNYGAISGATNQLVALRKSAGGDQEAESLYRELIFLGENLALRTSDLRILKDWREQLAVLLQNSGRMQEAVAARRAIFADYQEYIDGNPNDHYAHNLLAWMIATSIDPNLRDPVKAVEHAKEAVRLQPQAGSYWNTLGAAQYRAGSWQASIDAL